MQVLRGLLGVRVSIAAAACLVGRSLQQYKPCSVRLRGENVRLGSTALCERVDSIRQAVASSAPRPAGAAYSRVVPLQCESHLPRRRCRRPTLSYHRRRPTLSYQRRRRPTLRTHVRAAEEKVHIHSHRDSDLLDRVACRYTHQHVRTYVRALNMSVRVFMDVMLT